MSIDVQRLLRAGDSGELRPAGRTSLLWAGVLLGAAAIAGALVLALVAEQTGDTPWIGLPGAALVAVSIAAYVRAIRFRSDFISRALALTLDLESGRTAVGAERYQGIIKQFAPYLPEGMVDVEDSTVDELRLRAIATLLALSHWTEDARIPDRDYFLETLHRSLLELQDLDQNLAETTKVALSFRNALLQSSDYDLAQRLDLALASTRRLT